MINLRFLRSYLFNKRVLSTWESTFSAYGILCILFFILPLIDNEYSKQNIKYMLFILLGVSIFILVLNSTIQKGKRPISLWIIINFPLWFTIPIQIDLISKGIQGLLKLIKF